MIKKSLTLIASKLIQHYGHFPFKENRRNQSLVVYFRPLNQDFAVPFSEMFNLQVCQYPKCIKLQVTMNVFRSRLT